MSFITVFTAVAMGFVLLVPLLMIVAMLVSAAHRTKALARDRGPSLATLSDLRRAA